MIKREYLLLLLLAAFLVVVFFREVVVQLVTDWWWFSAVGYEQVFLREITGRLILFFLFGGFFLLFFFLNLRTAIRRGGDRWREFYSDLNVPFEVMVRFRRLLMVVFSLLMAAALGAWASDQWLLALQARHAHTFGVIEPLFHRDLMFYFFQLPLLSFLKSWAMWTLVLTAIAVLLVYWEGKAMGAAYNKIYISPRVRLHLIFLASLLFLLFAWHFQLKVYDLLYSQRGVIFGATYTDVYAELPAYRIMIGVSFVLFLAMVWGLWKKNVKIPLYAAGAYVAALIVLTVLVPALVQQLLVLPNEVTRERPYIERAIHHTRIGYGLDNIQERDFPAELDLTVDDIDRYASTLENIRLWDWRPLRQSYSQLQEIRLYYRFLDPDVDRYWIQDRYRQVMLAGRELDISRLPSQAQTWVNRHLKFTHGYGLAMSPVNEVTEAGMPVFFLRDIPPRSPVDLEVTRPEIYYGELTADYVLVRTTEEEFDYPVGESNAYSSYEGTGGVPMGSLGRRLLYSLKYGHLKMLISEYPTSETRIMENRRIHQRVRKIAPFLRYDRDPYMVLADGRLFWIQDAYTVSSRMPYSEPSAGGINYIRNSVKVVIDAYNGSVTYYTVAPDPITETLGAIFPDLFTSFEEMPETLRRHMRYPIDLFEIQAEKWRTFHMEDPSVFYNKEDMWVRPSEIYQGQQVPMESYYVMLSLEPEDPPEFVLMLPFNPSGRDNMVAWLAGRSDLENYGELVLFKFSKQELIYGPMQIEARIDQDPIISEQITLWSQQGGQVLRGNLLVIPVGNSLLYVEPLYLRAVRSELPELRRVILSYGPRVVMAETLSEGLLTVLSDRPLTRPPGFMADRAARDAPEGLAPPAADAQTAELAERAVALYRQANEHLRRGEWAEYGITMGELETLLTRLERALKGGGA